MTNQKPDPRIEHLRRFSSLQLCMMMKCLFGDVPCFDFLLPQCGDIFKNTHQKEMFLMIATVLAERL